MHVFQTYSQIFVFCQTAVNERPAVDIVLRTARIRQRVLKRLFILIDLC